MIMDHQKIGESTDGNRTTGLYGTTSHGSSADSYSCPQRREVVCGAGTHQRWYVIPPEALLTALKTILTSEKPSVTLCACRAPEPSTGVRFCALDAEGRVITVLPETCAGTASRKPSGNGCYTYETKGNVTDHNMPVPERDHSDQKK